MNAVDSSIPTISGCPETSMVTVPLGETSTSVTWIEPTATDDSGVAPTVFRTHTPGQQFLVGTTEVRYIFTDTTGNEATCSFSVIGNLDFFYISCIIQLTIPFHCMTCS